MKPTFSCLELSKFLHVTQGELLRPTLQPSMVTNPCASPWALVAGDAAFGDPGLALPQRGTASLRCSLTLACGRGKKQVPSCCMWRVVTEGQT